MSSHFYAVLGTSNHLVQLGRAHLLTLIPDLSKSFEHHFSPRAAADVSYAVTGMLS